MDPTLNELEERLDPARFFRISRAALVHLNAVAEVCQMPGGSGDVVLKNGRRLEVSRRGWGNCSLRWRVLDQHIRFIFYGGFIRWFFPEVSPRFVGDLRVSVGGIGAYRASSPYSRSSSRPVE